MAIPEGLRTSLNSIRETSIQNNTLYHRYVPEILPTSDIGSFASPILDNPNVMNEFMNVLVQRIVYTQVDIKLFNNPLRVLEGDRIPLGSIGQEIFINPARGRRFNVDDFAGLLAKYEADIKVQYHHLNSDLQYCVTITRAKLKDAFVSWSTLENFIDGLTQSLYNGAYIDQYNMTKGLVSSAYASNQVRVEVISNPNTEALAKEFITKARTMFLNMQTPTPNFNAWRQVGGYGRDILTWSNPEDIVFLVRNDIGAYLDVNVLAQTFNIDRSVLLGNIIYINDFNEYDNEGNLIFDGSNIVGMIADKSWFRIKEQETTMDEFYNANNRTWQYYLNVVRMYSYSLFANAVVFATALPSVPVTEISFEETAPEVTVDGKVILKLATTPAQTTSEITFTSGTTANATVRKIDNKTVEVTGVKAGTSVITAKSGNITGTVTVTVK
ncbi:MAG: hypothetical protein SOY33_05620 [Candidatus Onthovivens sp.]|nr:hypothetical protein [Bacilli bacterium]